VPTAIRIQAPILRRRNYGGLARYSAPVDRSTRRYAGVARDGHVGEEQWLTYTAFALKRLRPYNVKLVIMAFPVEKNRCTYAPYSAYSTGVLQKAIFAERLVFPATSNAERSGGLPERQ
jgi:hypothetical protein